MRFSKTPKLILVFLIFQVVLLPGETSAFYHHSEADILVSEKQNLRNEIKNAVSEIRNEFRQARNILEHHREADTVTGRTIKDRHGNIVRIEQHLLRPDRKTLQFINITKRDNYNYRGRLGINPTGSRLDSLETEITFSQDLPEKISNWAAFANNLKYGPDHFHPEKIDITVNNQYDQIEITSRWDENKTKMTKPDIFIVSGNEQTEGTWIMDTNTEVRYTGTGLDPYHHLDILKKAETWGISPEIWIHRPGNPEEGYWVRCGIESWLINNDGNIYNIDSFQNGTINPINLLRTSAVQASYTMHYNFNDDYILNRDSVNNNLKNRKLAQEGYQRASNFLHQNFDVVATPDTALDIIEKISKNLDGSQLNKN